MTEQPDGVEDDQDLEHFQVSARIDILPVLKALVTHAAAVTVRFDGNDNPFGTRLLSVRPEYEELVFDAAGLSDPDRLDGHGSLKAEAALDYMQVLFSATDVESTMLRGRQAFRGRIPSSIARIQRRSSVRYPVPSLNPPVCTVRLPPSGKVCRLRVMDISLGGISVMLFDPALVFEVGTMLPGCSLQVPDIGAIETNLNVRYVTQRQLNDTRLMGCRYANLSLFALAHIRGYVSKLERERLNRENA